MAVKLELYRVFQEVARMGNISAAAQNLFISQSAVSQSIKQLEEQLQVRLFSRSTRGVVLTSEESFSLTMFRTVWASSSAAKKSLRSRASCSRVS